jgi:hypothetical protein
MAQPAPPDKKKRQRMLMIGGAAALLLLFLYYRSKSSSSTSSTNATSPTDLQTAMAQGAQQQAALDAQNASASGGGTPSTFADNGANAAALGDAITSGLATIGQQEQSNWSSFMSQWQAAQTPSGGGGSSTPSTPAPAPAAPTSPVTINVSPTSPSVGTGTSATPSTHTTSAPVRPAGAPASAIWSGPHQPAGYTGIGGGWWVPAKPPIKKTGSKK